MKWHKKEGDKVRENEKIADVETDKAVMEMESFEAARSRIPPCLKAARCRSAGRSLTSRRARKIRRT